MWNHHGGNLRKSVGSWNILQNIGIQADPSKADVILKNLEIVLIMLE